MFTQTLAAVLGLIYLANGACMLWDPGGWYAAVPGVSASGPFNPHFVRDIGFAYLLAGAAFACAVLRPAQFVRWAAVGCAWPALHGLFHLAEWSAHGLPEGSILVAETLGVIAPALLGVAIACVGRFPRPST